MLTNVLLIIVDTLRADHLGCYIYQRATSPNIDNMAKEGVLFSNAFSQNNVTMACIGRLTVRSRAPRLRVFPCIET